MSTSRLAALPIDHLLAEMAAFPLASEAALRLRIVALDPELDPEFSYGTRELWREAERAVLGCFPAFSVDETVVIRDRIWFADQTRGAVPLHCYLRGLARLFLDAHGPVARPRSPDDAGPRGKKIPGLAAPDPEPREGRARWAWRWLSLALPPDLLVAALAENRGAPAEIDLLSPTLRTQLKDHGYAETHMHLGAAMDFPLLWLGALHAVASPETKAGAFASPGAALNEGRELGPWLLRAAIGRLVLASYLKRSPGDPERLAEFVTEVLAPRVAGESGAVFAASLHACTDDLLAGGLREPGFADLRGLYLALTGGLLGFKAILADADLDAAQLADPIAELFPPAPPATPEMLLIASTLRYLDEVPEDHDFALLFWQVVRVRALFYRHVVQRPMTAGLQWFIRFYGRIKPARKPIDKLGLASAVRLGGAGEGLRSLEFRTGPEKKVSALRRFVAGVHGAAKRGQPPSHECRDQHLPLARMECAEKPERPGSAFEIGLVFHLTKDCGGGAREGTPQAHRRNSHWDPNHNPTGYRFARFYNGWRREALALRWMVWHYPRSLGLIRGIDVATDELGVPTWVLAPLFRYLRALSESAAALDDRGKLAPLRCTAHAGEDFVHLLTGLRNVEEAVRRLGLRTGDRIGHGLSLGIDARDWCQRTGSVPMAVEERLLDLVWEWAWYGREGRDPPAGRAEFLDREIARLSAKVFGEPVSPYELERFVECLYDEKTLSDMGFPNGWPPHGKLSDPNLGRVRDYLTSADLFERGQETEWIDPIAEGEALAGLQAGVRRRLGQIGIAVEVNPTSNLLIGDLGDLSKHPLWRLCPPDGTGDAPPVSVCIGSDDPLTFATDLRAEYQLIHDTLVRAGRSEAEASEWIDAARKTGLAYRFTVPGKRCRPTYGRPTRRMLRTSPSILMSPLKDGKRNPRSTETKKSLSFFRVFAPEILLFAAIGYRFFPEIAVASISIGEIKDNAPLAIAVMTVSVALIYLFGLL